MRATAILVLLFLTTFVFAQTTSKDSLRAYRASLKLQMDSVHQSFNSCTDFELNDTPEWANHIKNAKTYYRNCRWSGTYIVLNPDSTFLLKHNGEGSDYLQKGKWKVKSDSILVLEGNNKLTAGFKVKMKRFEKANYKSAKVFYKQYLFRQNMLVSIDIVKEY